MTGKRHEKRDKDWMDPFQHPDPNTYVYQWLSIVDQMGGLYTLSFFNDDLYLCLPFYATVVLNSTIRKQAKSGRTRPSRPPCP